MVVTQQGSSDNARTSMRRVNKSRLTDTVRRRRAAMRRGALLVGLMLGTTWGCSLIPDHGPAPHDTRESYHDHVGLKIEYPDVTDCPSPPTAAAMSAGPPLAFQDPADLPTYDLTLAEAVRIAVSQSPVLRTLGGTVVNAPQGSTTVYDPAISYANPLSGVEGALSEFDAQVNGVLNWNKNEQPNNVQAGGLGAAFNPRASKATQSTFNAEIAKQTAQGGRFALRHNVFYNRNNQPFRQFQSDFVGWVEAEWRQPLMQGSGTLFNRIAGPNSGIGQYNGVLIARINNDVSLADFEAAVINLVADVEQAYWDLYGGYRVLEAQLRGREAALKTFQVEQARFEAGTSRVDQLDQTVSQYYLFSSTVENALAGPQGLYFYEQRLRYLLGLPASDGRLIKPATDPQEVRVIFDWESALTQALERRVEIRRQEWFVKRRELELIAARLNRRPQLDFLGQYRWRGLGDHLIGPTDAGVLDNLYGTITDGNYQEWVAGMEMSFPVGLRRASAAVSHAQLSLARERAVLNETELRVSHELSNASREVDRAYRLLQTNLNRWLADQRQVKSLALRASIGQDDIFVLLQTQRQLVTSESDFYRSLVDYNLAIRELHRRKGSLLAYNQVQLAEGPWAAKAYTDAYELGRFFTPRLSPDKVRMPQPVSRGDFDPSQPVLTQGAMFAQPDLIESEATDYDASNAGPPADVRVAPVPVPVPGSP
jgi:outer membrane protein TolC